MLGWDWLYVGLLFSLAIILYFVFKSKKKKKKQEFLWSRERVSFHGLKSNLKIYFYNMKKVVGDSHWCK